MNWKQRLADWQIDHRFWDCGDHSSASVFFVPIYGSQHKRSWWFRGLIRPVFAIGNKCHRAKWWLKWRLLPRHRHFIVNTGLEPGYYDCDILMLHACMALLKRYIEEMGGEMQVEKFNQELRAPGADGYAPLGTCAAQAGGQSEALTIWRWWTYERPKDRKRCDALLMILFGGRERVTWEKVEGQPLYEMIFKEFDGHEKKMHKTFRALEKKINDDEQKMLHRLIDIRRSLWT